MKIVAIVGSNRKESYNKKNVKFIQERYKDKLDIEIVSIENFPMYCEDIELFPTREIIEVKQKIAASQAVLISTTEYNHSIPAVLKNALEWFSRVDKVMVRKPVMIIGATPGVLGTVRAQEHLRVILNALECLVMPGNEVYIGQVKIKVDDIGNIIHQPTIDFLDKVVDNFMRWIVLHQEGASITKIADL